MHTIFLYKFYILFIFIRKIQKYFVLGNFRELCDIIGKSDEVLQRNSAHLNTVLETLDIQQHSLGVLAVLVAKFSLPQVINIIFSFIISINIISKNIFYFREM